MERKFAQISERERERSRKNKDTNIQHMDISNTDVKSLTTAYMPRVLTVIFGVLPLSAAENRKNPAFDSAIFAPSD